MSGTVTGLDLDRLEALAGKATPGVWKLWLMEILADQDGTSNVDTAVRVANTFYRDEQGKPRTFDADFIAEFHNAAPALLAAARTVSRVDALFSGGPDTACRTVWQDGIECVSVPIADLRAALGTEQEGQQ